MGEKVLNEGKAIDEKASSEKNSGIRQLIDAHGWLGVIISIALFIVFWAGSILLFLPELHAWAETPAHPVDRDAPDRPLRLIVENLLRDYPLNREEHLTILPAGEQRPYHQVYIDLLRPEGYEGPEQVAELKVDPKTGAVVGELEQFHLPNFLYQLHYDLHLPGGLYLVGLVTLVFMILIFTGVWIHAPKLFRHFFLFRRERRRNKLLDLHNVVGVMSLPFTLMYALTGLIFNLSIVFQIVFAVFLYQGDANALLADAGYPTVEQKPSGVPLDMDAAWTLVEELEREAGPFDTIRFYNYGDENAMLQVYGRDNTEFARGSERLIALQDGRTVIGNVREENTVRRGLDVVAALHFGDFAGLDLRILYFLLGMGVAGMIVAGNLLWLDKREKQRRSGPRLIAFFANLTLAGCCGTVFGTAAIFLAERVMPPELAGRGDWIGRIFVLSLLLASAAAWLIADKRRLLRVGLLASAALALLTVAADWLLYGAQLPALWQQGYRSIVGVEAGLLLTAALCLWIARSLAATAPAESDAANEPLYEADSIRG